MSHNLILLIAGLVIILLVFQALLSLLKTVFSTAVAILIIVMVMTFFGFSPQELIDKIINLPQTIQELVVEFKKLLGL